MENKKMFEDVQREERLTLLKENARSISKMNVPYIFSPEELDEMRCSHTEIVTDIEEKDEAKKQFVKSINEETKPMKKRAHELRKEIRAGKIDVEKEVYEFEDHDNNQMNYFDGEGELVYSRPMKPAERQYRIKPVVQTGTND